LRRRNDCKLWDAKDWHLSTMMGMERRNFGPLIVCGVGVAFALANLSIIS